MKVILREDVSNLGRAGETQEVSAGYFRNFLLPRGLAVEATKGLLKAHQVKASNISAKQSREREQMQRVADEVSQMVLTFPVKVGDQGRMYGSITTKDIADELQKVGQIEVDRHKITLTEPLKSAGEHTVSIRLDQGIDAELKVQLVPETE